MPNNSGMRLLLPRRSGMLHPLNSICIGGKILENIDFFNVTSILFNSQNLNLRGPIIKCPRAPRLGTSSNRSEFVVESPGGTELGAVAYSCRSTG